MRVRVIAVFGQALMFFFEVDGERPLVSGKRSEDDQ
jgi:hypothetical protein